MFSFVQVIVIWPCHKVSPIFTQNICLLRSKAHVFVCFIMQNLSLNQRHPSVCGWMKNFGCDVAQKNMIVPYMTNRLSWLSSTWSWTVWVCVSDLFVCYIKTLICYTSSLPNIPYAYRTLNACTPGRDHSSLWRFTDKPECLESLNFYKVLETS